MQIHAFAVKPDTYAAYWQAYNTYRNVLSNRRPIEIVSKADQQAIADTLITADALTPPDLKQSMARLREVEDLVWVSGFMQGQEWQQPDFASRMGYYTQILALFSGLELAEGWLNRPSQTHPVTYDNNLTHTYLQDQHLHQDCSIASNHRSITSLACATPGPKPCSTQFLNLTSALNNPFFCNLLLEQKNLRIEFGLPEEKENAQAHLKNRLHKKDFFSLKEKRLLPTIELTIESEASQLTDNGKLSQQVLLSSGQIVYFPDDRLLHGAVAHGHTVIPEDFEKNGSGRRLLASTHHTSWTGSVARFTDIYREQCRAGR